MSWGRAGLLGGFVGAAGKATAALLLLSACSGDPRPKERLGKAEQELSATTLRTLGFEALDDWSGLWSSPTLSLSSLHTEGQASLAVGGGGWMHITSRALSKEAPAPSVVGYDVRVATEPVNQWWYGATDLSIDAPSVGIWGQYLGHVELTGFPKGEFKRVEFPIPAHLQTKLEGNYHDLTFRIVVNVPGNEAQPYLLDRFTFGPVETTCVPQSDGNPCTQDTCVNGSPAHLPLPAGTACDTNADACDGTGSCDANATCVLGAAPVVDDGNPCTTDVCDPVAGVSHAPKPAGTRCDDEDACNGEEICNAFGQCLQGPPPVVDDGNPCTEDSCDPASGVVHAPLTVGTSCADADVCNGDELCDGAGSCVAGAPLVVPPNTTCVTFSCDAAVGVVSSPMAAGSACDDATVCNGRETCDGAGSCVAGTPPVVDDGNPCTDDSCDSAIGAVHVAVADGTSCNDDSVCNGFGMCAAGACAPGTPLDIDDGIDCTQDLCDPMTGEVTHPLAPPGTECSPIDACHEEGTCDLQGQCIPGAAFAFDDGNPCTIETCDPILGLTRRECSPIDQTVSTVVADANAWIYSGSDPLQTGVAPGTITRQRGTLLTGHVASQAGLPLGGAVVTILNHPELGQTVSKATGEFTMVVNGGGRLTVQVKKPGFLDSDRSLEVPWAGSVRVDEIRLLQADPQVTEVDLLDESEPFHVVQGSVSEDDDGIRQGTLLVPNNTLATMHLEGSSEPINLMNIRITEFTVGPSGVQAMPAALPPTSHYTYAFEVNADEAVAAGARSIEFTVPLVYYVHNFLEFPNGTVVPVGSYSREKGVWIPEQNGLVIEVVSITGGLADVSIDADPQPETPAELAVIGIDDDERARLAELYFPGTSLWRVLIPHFTQPWDCNWGVSPPDDAVPPPPQPPRNDPLPDPTTCNGSIIECENQVLREQLPLAGTPFSLNYSSFNVPGRTDAREVPLTITGPVPPASLQRVDVSVDVGNGTHAEYSFAPSPNQTFTYFWPDQDAFGRPNQGRQMASIEMRNVYTPVYQRTEAFGYPGNGVAISGNAARTELYFTSTIERPVGSWEQRTSSSGLGGWSISVHHAYDPASGSIIRGDGQVQKATAIGSTAYTTGGGTPEASDYIAAAPDGSFYLTMGNRVERRGYPPGSGSTTVAGLGPSGFSGDNGPATAAHLRRRGPFGESQGNLALGPDGSLYIADTFNFRIRRVSPAGIITTFAGNGQQWSAGDPIGDGQLAVDVAFRMPLAVAVGSDGAVYIADSEMHRIRRVATDGTISTVAGNGTGSSAATPEDPTVARSTGDRLTPSTVAVLPDGTLLAGDSNGWIRRYEINGRVSRAAGVFCSPAGSCPGGSLVEGVDPATSRAGFVTSIAVAPDGTWYFGNRTNGLIHHVADGTGVFVAGGGASDTNHRSTGAPPRSFSLGSLDGISVGPGGLFIRHTAFFGVQGLGGSYRNAITLLRQATPGIGPADVLLPSPDGDEVYVFDKTGRHLKTRDAITGADKYTFVYTGGLLTRIDDAYGNATSITRDSAGTPLAITSSDGQITNLSLDSNGYLRTVTDPLNQTATLTHSSSGLLMAYQDVRGHTSSFEYDSKGRLLRDTDAAGGTKELTRTILADGFGTTYSTVGAGTRATDVHYLADGTQRRVIRLPDGTTRIEHRRKDGSLVIQHPDGTKVTETQTGDSRYGVVSPVVSTTTELPPIPPATQGLVRTENRSVSVTLSNPLDPLSVSTLTRQRNVNGRIWSESYNQNTKTWTISSPVGRRLFRILNTRGDLLRETMGENTNALLAQLLAYDSRGRLSTVTHGSRQSLFSYFANGATAGYVEATSNPLLQTTTFTRDALGRTISELDPAGNLTQFAWDPLGNLTGVTPPGRPKHDMSYTPVNLMSEYSPPVLASIPDGRTVYEYSIARQLERATRPDGLVTEYDYDAAGRLIDITTPDGVYHRNYYGLIPCAGCAAGYLSQITSPDGIAIGFEYNGQLLTKSIWSGAVSGAMAFAYNNDFRVRTETVTSASGSAAYQFGYDNDQLLTCASPTNCTSPGADALRLTYNSSNGLPGVSTLGPITETPTYSNLGELATQTGRVGSTVVFSEDYNPAAVPRDALGRIKRKIELVNGTTQTWDYTYDLAGRLQTVLLNGSAYESYTYDGNGNRLSVVRPSGTTSATYDDQDRLLTSGNWTYTYTANGELLTKSNTSTGESWAYQYDVFGNLKRVDLPSGDVIEYLVDGQNRRVGKKKNGILQKQWLYRNQLHPVAELDGAGNLLARFVFASGKNSPDLVITGGVTYRVFTDQLGSPRALINASTGAVAGVMRHDAWGVVLEDSASTLMPFGFAGGLYDAETGLIRFGARDYEPSVGRWVSKDPIRFGGGQVNLLVYAGNDPVNARDSNGLYGTNDCDYYDSRCDESGGDYYCEIAPDRCNWFPKYPDPDPSRDDDFEGWARCTRQCLQDCDAAMNFNPDRNECRADPGTDDFYDWASTMCHTTCYTGCFAHKITGGYLFGG